MKNKSYAKQITWLLIFQCMLHRPPILFSCFLDTAQSPLFSTRLKSSKIKRSDMLPHQIVALGIATFFFIKEKSAIMILLNY